MKKIIFFTALLFITLSSCRKENTSSVEQQSLAKEATTIAQDQTLAQTQSQTNGSSSKGAVTYSNVFREDVTGNSIFNPCTNELMTIQSGYLLLNFHGVLNGENSTIIVHANVQGVKAVGESGREYYISGSYNRQESYFSNGVFTTKLEHFDRFVTSGRDNNLIVKDTYYIKVDADGNVTVIRDETHEVYCQ